MSILIRKVSIKFFYKYCKACPHFKENNNKHKYYCYLDKTRKWFWNGWKKRILFCNFVKNNKKATCVCLGYKNICNEIRIKENNRRNKEKEKYKDFSNGFFDYLNNNKPITYIYNIKSIKDYKSYIEGYTKAMLLKKDCDGKKINTDIKCNININQNTSSTH